MGYPQFLSFIDKAAHVDPGYKIKPAARRNYQKIITNTIFANQLVVGGTFHDEDAEYPECENGKYIAIICITGCIVFILVLIVYSLRRTCHELEDKLRAPRIVTMPMMPIMPPPLPLMASPPNGRGNMMITTIDEEDEAAMTPEVNIVEPNNNGGPVADTPPEYQDVVSPANPSEAAAERAEDETGAMGGAAAPVESSQVRGNASQRPYPLMLPNNYDVGQPIEIASP